MAGSKSKRQSEQNKINVKILRINYLFIHTKKLNTELKKIAFLGFFLGNIHTKKIRSDTKFFRSACSLIDL